VADVFLPYIVPAGAPTHKLNTRKVGTDAGLDVLEEYLVLDGWSVLTGNRFQAGNGAAAQMPTVPCKRLLLKAEIANPADLFIGDSSVTVALGYPLLAGDTETLELTNVNLVWVIAAQAGVWIRWLALGD